MEPGYDFRKWWTVLMATTGTLLAASFFIWLLIKKKLENSVKDPHVSTKQKDYDDSNIMNERSCSQNDLEKTVKVFFGTQTGTAEGLAYGLSEEMSNQGWKTEVINLKNYDPDDNLVEDARKKQICVFLLSTYMEGEPPDDAKWFCKWVKEACFDFRMQKSLLSGMSYVVFGLGSSLYAENFNLVAKNLDEWLSMLQAKRLMEVGLGDENVSADHYIGLEGDFLVWKKRFFRVIEEYHCKTSPCCKENSQEEMEEVLEYESSSEDGEGSTGGSESGSLVDMEDLGTVLKKVKHKANGNLVNGVQTQRKRILPEMITPILRQALTKQGYKLVGSHSGVKLCRWTKSMLRGRGGCYKHTFYGIESHRCMETTPSLACANKCVFCWRHHSNPVGTEWKWKMDDPEILLEGVLKNHYQMIKEFKGVPGVKPERLAEGMEPKHCALSLVGEPIMYPEINKFIRLLHERGISSFLVTNAQFPDAITSLDPVTQLYVSVDASSKESLKKIDRPLFRDFWTRFLDSLKALSKKGQRTVYRLTLVKSWNIEELQGYVNLVELGRPDFIEVKGVTYCGTSKASNLTMENVPWHKEVLGFVQELSDKLPDYEIASEHEHSNCVLIANKKFNRDGVWWTWIDYPKFSELVQRYYVSNGLETFTSLDYMAPTPHWGQFGANERGFDPLETRFLRKNRKDISGC
ncbi:S-adenosyl-L-methionine-dependent tRNA 4-demethylwyosine synthase-like [Limulus polyphemus]|uniref:tRNA 4-demethylwyosine synthase (AdoMet-dependent) n=1 Tax=Limulus polyphemus TaxID=6850 RepID=A0ABM1S632_LIMPO|nr:S-adenosyl-L-methionine-dependent tRNA 4-demethylwyosine synthase-like [Limulus polyphemus]XP_022239087.1 S-adenosyl-L-methionine-dependent tRNA 4-demethylwyosine synthase-like [Limulus polyphemus]XP_022239088.1 S-adenosyl-L-methionine-dependent tRNA 4-demethylwyosine synthase-like [Limulus polyphemus]